MAQNASGPRLFLRRKERKNATRKGLYHHTIPPNKVSRAAFLYLVNVSISPPTTFDSQTVTFSFSLSTGNAHLTRSGRPRSTTQGSTRKDSLDELNEGQATRVRPFSSSYILLPPRIQACSLHFVTVSLISPYPLNLVFS